MSRTIFLSKNRGMKELSNLLVRFIETHPSACSDPIYQEIVEWDDITLWDALFNKNQTLDESTQKLLQEIVFKH